MTNSALIYESKCWGMGEGCVVSANEYSCAHHVAWSPKKPGTFFSFMVYGLEPARTTLVKRQRVEAVLRLNSYCLLPSLLLCMYHIWICFLAFHACLELSYIVFSTYCRGSQRDVVCLWCPIAPSYTSLNAGWLGRLQGLSQWVQLYTSPDMEPK